MSVRRTWFARVVPLHYYEIRNMYRCRLITAFKSRHKSATLKLSLTHNTASAQISFGCDICEYNTQVCGARKGSDVFIADQSNPVLEFNRPIRSMFIFSTWFD